MCDFQEKPPKTWSMAKTSGARRCRQCSGRVGLYLSEDILKALKTLDIHDLLEVVLVLWTPFSTTGSRRSGRH